MIVQKATWAPPGVQAYTVINRCSVPPSRQGTLQINRTSAPALQNTNAISPCFASKQILPFGFAEQVQLRRIPRNTRRNMQRHFCFGRSIRSSWCSKKCITMDIPNCNCLLDRKSVNAVHFTRSQKMRFKNSFSAVRHVRQKSCFHVLQKSCFWISFF